MMAAVAAKDERAQHAVVSRLSGRVRRVAGLLCRSSADADDAAQLALLEILASAESFRFATSLERWADKITARTALRLQRREHARRNILERWLDPTLLPWGTSLSISEGERLGLRGVLERLSPERREALVLRHALGYTVEEIAELTSTPAGTIKDRLVTGRRQVREMLRRDALRASRPGGRS